MSVGEAVYRCVCGRSRPDSATFLTEEGRRCHRCDARPWKTPHGELMARVRSRYRGLLGQTRVELVDGQGRVHHFDADEVSGTRLM